LIEYRKIGYAFEITHKDDYSKLVGVFAYHGPGKQLKIEG
jgi:hypothetical protein